MSAPYVVITRPGSVSAPYTYALASGESFAPETVTATFDCTGAAGACLPCLSVYSENGVLLGRFPAAQVAAGDTAEVTWAPFLTAGVAAAPSGTSLSYAYINATNLTPASGASPVAIDLPSGGFKTSDAVTFAYDVLGGVHGIHVKVAGTYLVIAGGWYDSGSALAGQFAQINITSPGRFTNELAIGPFENFGGGDFEATCLFATIWQGGGASVTGPNMLLLEACENSSGGANLDAGLQAIAISSVVV